MSQHETRVLNLIKKVDLENASLKKWAVVKLLKQFPGAKRIRFAGKCHCKGNTLLSFQLDDLHGKRWQRDGWEECGYYCPKCRFSNAGAREIRS